MDEISRHCFCLCHPTSATQVAWNGGCAPPSSPPILTSTHTLVSPSYCSSHHAEDATILSSKKAFLPATNICRRGYSQCAMLKYACLDGSLAGSFATLLLAPLILCRACPCVTLYSILFQSPCVPHTTVTWRLLPSAPTSCLRFLSCQLYAHGIGVG